MKKRKLFNELLKQKEGSKISILLGARQVGKTTLLKGLHEEICVKLKNKGLYLDLDIFSNFEKISTFENLLNLIKLNGYEESKDDRFYLFLDEFQRYSDLSIIMKNAYDNIKGLKIYASGSSSLKIKRQVQDSLAGRKIINIVHPLDFEEFLWFKEDTEATKQLEIVKKLKGKELAKVSPKLQTYLEEFLVFGGFPEVALTEKEKDKIIVLESIFDLYIKKDLVEYLNIKKIMNAKKLIEYLAINNGQKTKYEGLCRASHLNFRETKNYMEMLKETHLIFILRPFFTNANKELTKIPKIYFTDNGVRNYFINNFNNLSKRDDKGFLLEGFIISELIKNNVKEETLKFWQDKNKHEVDVILKRHNELTPIEIKFKTELKKDDFIGINKFVEEDNNEPVILSDINIQENNIEEKKEENKMVDDPPNEYDAQHLLNQITNEISSNLGTQKKKMKKLILKLETNLNKFPNYKNTVQ